MKFRNLDEKDYPEFLRLYNSSFPEDERRLYESPEDIANFVKKKGGKFSGIAAEERNGDPGTDYRFIGFLSYWTFKGFIYIEHFAVDPELRGKRIGTEMLDYLFSTIGENVLIEVERPETEEARRRIAFYERNGFRLHDDIHYVQPPYSPGQNGLEMMLMTHGDVRLSDTSDLHEMLAEVYNVGRSL